MSKNFIKKQTPAAPASITIPATLIALIVLVQIGCMGTKGNVDAPMLVEKAGTSRNGEPTHITVQHILIAFQGSLPGKSIPRSQQEAEQLAQELLERARSGEDFNELVRTYTDDSPTGIYHMANFGEQTDSSDPDPAKHVMPREGMVAAFGDVGFPLKVGEIGMSRYDQQSSPFGWHIVKRLR